MTDDNSYEPLAAIFSEVRTEVEKVDKQRAILAHLHSAFELVAYKGNPLSVHLLAMAAHEMLVSVAHAKKTQVGPPIKGLGVRESARDRREATEVYNFLKHSRNDHDHAMHMRLSNLAVLNEFTLVSACAMYRQLFDQEDFLIQSYFAYHALRFRNGLDGELSEIVTAIEAASPITEEERLAVFRNRVRRTLGHASLPA